VEGVHLPFLFTTNISVNLLAMVLTIWLGLYLVSRSPRYPIAWLKALSLWFMAGVFFNTLMAVYPPVELLKPQWLRIFFPFWPYEVLTGSHNKWLQGWSLAPALALWHHVTILLLPGNTTTWRWVRIFTGYLLALFAVIIQINAPILFTSEQSNPLFLNSLQASPWYPIFATARVLLSRPIRRRVSGIHISSSVRPTLKRHPTATSCSSCIFRRARSTAPAALLSVPWPALLVKWNHY
jgi:hypothetical protein